MSQISSTEETNDELTDGSPSSEIGLTLYLRAAPSGPARRRQLAVRSQFEALDLGGGLVETAVERWPKTVTTPVDGREPAARTALERYEAFREAVSAAGGRLEPFFQRRRRTGGLLVNAGEGDVFTFPVCCLTVRHGEALTGLFPCWLDGHHYSVEEGLAAVADGNPNNLLG